MLIEELKLSARTYNCLKRKKINTVEQLMGMSDDDLMKIRSFGAGCLKEVREKIGGAPAVPGPKETDMNIMEMCFRNGEKNMKEKVVSMLMDHKTWSDGVCHHHIAEIIRKVECL